MKRPAVKRPAVKRPAVKRPAVKRPAVKRPAVKRPAVKRPAVKRPAVKRPAAKRAAATARAKKAAATRKARAEEQAKKRSAAKKAAATRKARAEEQAKKRSAAAKKAAATRKVRAEEQAKKRSAAAKKAAATRRRRRREVEKRQAKLDELERERQKNRRKRGASGRPTKAQVKNLRRRIELEGKKELEKKRSDDRTLQEDFERLLEVARKKKQLPKLRPSEKRIIRYETELTKGQKLGVGVGNYVNEETVEEILYRIEKQAVRMTEGVWPLWMTRFDFTFMGERLIGYGMRVLVDADLMASSFYTQGVDSTGAWNTKEGMLLRLRKELEELASEKNTIVYLNHVVIQNFRRIR